MATINDALAAGLVSMGGDMYAAVEKELRLGFELQKRMAFARQARLAQANHRNPRRMVNGLGQVTMSIDPVLRVLAEREFGKGCFGDKGFRRELLRDNPELRVPTQRKAIIVR